MKRAASPSPAEPTTTKKVKIKNESILHERHLGNLARLLEGKSACVTVYYNEQEKEMIVTSNTLKNFKGSNPENAFKNKDAEFMIHILSRLLRNFSEHTDNDREDKDIALLSEACRTKINMANHHGSITDPKIHIENEVLKKVVIFLYRQKNQIAYVTNESESIRCCLSEEENEILMKSKNDSKNLSSNDKKQLKKLYEKITQIRLAYTFIWRLVRDYKKVTAYFKIASINSCKILGIGEKNEDAEVRMLGYLIDKNLLLNKTKDELSKPIYFGISKLCCAHSVCTLGAVNKLLNAKLGLTFEEDGEKTVITAERLNIAAKKLLKEALDPAKTMIKTADQHGLHFEKWCKPSYLKGKQYISPFSVAKILRLNRHNELEEKTVKLSNEGKSTISDSFYRQLRDFFDTTMKKLKDSIEQEKKEQHSTSIVKETPINTPHSGKLEAVGLFSSKRLAGYATRTINTFCYCARVQADDKYFLTEHKIEHIEKLIILLHLLSSFEKKEQLCLKKIQKCLFDKAVESNNESLKKMSIAMNTIIHVFEKEGDEMKSVFLSNIKQMIKRLEKYLSTQEEKNNSPADNHAFKSPA